MTTEKYRSPSYRPELVTHRYVKRISAARYKVFECCARSRAKNRLKALQALGAGPTIREYECHADALPPAVVRQLAYAPNATCVTWP